MQLIPDFEDMLGLLETCKVRYLVIGGLAFIYHAKPRFTKDMDLWIDPDPVNVEKANMALRDFGSPYLLDASRHEEILQLGVAPDRIDFLLNAEGVRFETAWKKRVRGKYGSVTASWIDIDSLIRIKSRIDHPRHREDVRVLKSVKKMKK